MCRSCRTPLILFPAKGVAGARMWHSSDMHWPRQSTMGRRLDIPASRQCGPQNPPRLVPAARSFSPTFNRRRSPLDCRCFLAGHHHSHHNAVTTRLLASDAQIHWLGRILVRSALTLNFRSARLQPPPRLLNHSARHRRFGASQAVRART
jgi:hypothetical protein